jgi:uroporphyrinogen III methyltransferase/synthase
MTIILYKFLNQDIELFQTFIESKLSHNGFKINWKTQVIESESPISLNHVFKDQNISMAIIPANLLEYPISEGYKPIALLDSNIKPHISNDFDNSKFILIVRKEENSYSDIFRSDDLRNKYGKVFITGFGPGDPDLLTIKAIKAIKNADVIFYDSLINQEFLNQFQIEKVFVGKRKGDHTYGQNDIDEMLYQSAISGKNTVRLKGGDPFIFGRGGEEFDYLRKRFVEAEVIPGITAAFGAAASLGISLTQRLISSSVAFCTGFPKENRRIPDADTLVFYMSASNIKETAQLLIKSGRKTETPVALIRNATLFDQESQFTTLFELANGKSGLESPMVAIIGDVAVDKNLFI